MALNTQLANAQRSRAADAVCVRANSGILRIYDGSQPATADTAIGAQVILAELTMNSTAFGAASNGVATANAITSDTSANNTGTAAWFRLFESDGTTVICDGTVGTSGDDMNLNTVSIVSGANVSISSATFTMPKT
jgi:hypothetical protein